MKVAEVRPSRSRMAETSAVSVSPTSGVPVTSGLPVGARFVREACTTRVGALRISSLSVLPFASGKPSGRTATILAPSSEAVTL